MARSGSRRRTRVRTAAGLLLVPAALAATMASGVAGSSAQMAPRATVAAIDPSLVMGRGAQLGIVQQEAENATTTGTTYCMP